MANPIMALNGVRISKLVRSWKQRRLCSLRQSMNVLACGNITSRSLSALSDGEPLLESFGCCISLHVNMTKIEVPSCSDLDK